MKKPAASIKIGVQTVASMLITSTFTFGGKIYDLAHDTLFNNEDEDKLSKQDHTPNKAAEEITHENNVPNHGDEL